MSKEYDDSIWVALIQVALIFVCVYLCYKTDTAGWIWTVVWFVLATAVSALSEYLWNKQNPAKAEEEK